MQDERPAKRVMQRCPSCGAKVDLDVLACPMCGHEFGTTMPNKAVAYDPPGRKPRPEQEPDPEPEDVAPEPVRALPPPLTPRARIVAVLRRLPWGVIGMLAVLGSIGGGVALALKNQSFSERFLPAQPTPHITPQFFATRAPIAAATLPAPVLPTVPTPLPPTSTPVPPRIHTVESGEVCSTIAEQYQIGLSVLIAANNLNAECALRVGDRLRIPPPGSSAAAAAATTVSTPTPAPIQLATQTPRIGFAEPIAIGPVDGLLITNTADALTLQWLTVGLLAENEWYVVTVQPDNQPLVPIFETKATALKLSPAVIGDFPERKVTWWVQVKRLVSTTPGGARTYEDRSAPSLPRTFTWRK
jgi:LysM repeat protein